MPQARVALLEFKFHREVIPSQLLFLLNQNFDVHVIMDTKLWDDALFGCCKDKLKTTLLTHSTRWYNKVYIFFFLQYYFRSRKITHVIINTLDSTFLHVVLRFLPRRMHLVGIAHRVHEIDADLAFRSNVKRMNAVLTLSEDTLAYLRNTYPALKKTQSFYPVFFCPPSATMDRDPHELWIAIPGQLSFKRRDYRLLLDYVGQKPSQPLRFLLLGNAAKFDGPEIADRIKAEGLDRYFFYKNEFIPYAEFIELISICDYVLPLIGEQTWMVASYQQSQVTAAMNWAMGFQKHVIVHQAFSHLRHLQRNTLWYTNASFPALLDGLQKPAPYTHGPETDFHIQAARYLETFQPE